MRAIYVILFSLLFAPLSWAQTNPLGFSIYDEAETKFEASMNDAFTAFQNGEYTKAKEIWLLHSRNGNAQASYNIGTLYSNGYGVGLSETEAFPWYKKAAEAGYVNAQVALAKRYKKGQGTVNDETLARKWYQTAAQSGHFNSYVKLGEMDFASGQEQSALNHYLRAANGGDIEGQRLAGLMYSGMYGLPENRDQLRYWLKKAADNGDSYAAQRLASFQKEWRETMTFEPPKNTTNKPSTPPASEPNATNQTREIISGKTNFPIFANTEMNALGDAAASCYVLLLQNIKDRTEEVKVSRDLGQALDMETWIIFANMAEKVAKNPDRNGGVSGKKLDDAMLKHAVLMKLSPANGPNLEQCNSAEFLSAG